MIYLDSSFVVSVYSRDAHSAAATGLIQEIQNALLITPHVELETVNALQLRVFRKQVSTQEADASLRNFEQDTASGIFQMQPLPASAFDRARLLSRQYTARGGCTGTRRRRLLQLRSATAKVGAGRWSEALSDAEASLTTRLSPKTAP